MHKNRKRVLVAGIGGASLGTEILKCLTLADRYSIFGCDISPVAYGHFEKGFERTFLVDRDKYVESVLDVCKKEEIEFIVPGGEEPMGLLSAAEAQVLNNGIRLAGNSSEIVEICSDKLKTFQILSDLGFAIPKTMSVSSPEDLKNTVFPCVIKPATGSGGSSFVFLCQDMEEALLYSSYLLKNSKIAVVQEYMPVDEGEFTVGVLSLPDGRILGSIALQRFFHSKLSVLFKGHTGLISSGYSQGLIDDFPEIRDTAEYMAKSLKSVGPINIQGRLKDGQFIPFEINPRFSASAYLRAMAGFNEVDIFLQYMANGRLEISGKIRYGYYLRSLSEVFVSKKDLLE